MSSFNSSSLLCFSRFFSFTVLYIEKNENKIIGMFLQMLHKLGVNEKIIRNSIEEIVYCRVLKGVKYKIPKD
jgi:hypothetical protein